MKIENYYKVRKWLKQNNWFEISMYTNINYDFEFVDKHIDKIYWDLVPKCKILTKEFIIRYFNNFSPYTSFWDARISENDLEYLVNFLNEKDIDWKRIAKINANYLSSKFILNHIDKFQEKDFEQYNYDYNTKKHFYEAPKHIKEIFNMYKDLL